MSKSRTALVALLLLIGVGLTLTARSAPRVTPRPEPVLYFPTTVGAKWVYETNYGDEYTSVVTAVETKGDVQFVTVEGIENGKRWPGERVSVSPRGLHDLSAYQANAGACLLQLPVRPGERWADGRADLSITIGGERVRVPAGEYDAIRVEQIHPLMTAEVRVTHWYAPGVGEVKRVIVRHGLFDESDRILEVKVLKTFSPGRP